MHSAFQLVLRNNALFFLNCFIFVLLLYGLIISYGGSYIGESVIYFAAFIFSYFLFNKWWNPEKPIGSSFSGISEKWLNIAVNSFIVFIACFQVVHFVAIGNVPVIKAVLTTDYYYIAQIRQDIKKVDSNLINYTASFIIKSVMPVMLFMLYFRDKKRFWILAVISIFYALALMQKAYIVTIFLPLIISLLLQRKWWRASVFIGMFMAGIIFLVMTTNPFLRPFGWYDKTQVASLDETAVGDQGGIAEALYDRVFITTGEMVGNWFRLVPDTLPYLKGNGYRLVAEMKGDQFVDYSREIYDRIYLKEAAMGFDGTATTAYFMYDYSNFGIIGLIIAGCYLAFFLVFIKGIFRDDFRSLVSLNGLFVIWLSSAAFTTTLFSGGWILTIVLYCFFKPYFSAAK